VSPSSSFELHCTAQALIDLSIRPSRCHSHTIVSSSVPEGPCGLGTVLLDRTLPSTYLGVLQTSTGHDYPHLCDLYFYRHTLWSRRCSYCSTTNAACSMQHAIHYSPAHATLVTLSILSRCRRRPVPLVFILYSYRQLGRSLTGCCLYLVWPPSSQFYFRSKLNCCMEVA